MSDENTITIPAKETKRQQRARTKAETIERRQNVQKALELRIKGFTYDEILRDIPGVWKTISVCQKAVARLLDDAELDLAREYKLVSIKRLEECVAAVLGKAKNGNLLAVDRVIRITKRQGEILGFDEGGDSGLQVGFEIIVRNESDRVKTKD